MPRTAVEIQNDITTVRNAIKEMLSTEKGSVGLKQAIDVQSGRVDQGMRPTLPQAREWLRELEVELSSVESQLKRPPSFVQRLNRDL